jgi:peptide chain release factor 1
LSPGHVVAQISGNGAGHAFRHESGKHVVQRIPRTEQNGRKQTSVVSVAVLPLPPERDYTPLPNAELEIITQRKGGPGGQNQNKVASAVRMKHTPTGLMVFISGRDQGQNKRDALRILTARVHELRNNQTAGVYNNLRREMVDTGRGDKIRTYNFLKQRCTDHRLGTSSTRVDSIMKGRFDLILK